MGVTYPFATLRLYRTIDVERPGAVVIATRLTGPSVVVLDDVSELNVRSVGLGWGLYMTDAGGVRYDCSFISLSRTDLVAVKRPRFSAALIRGAALG
jgi:hypothetical protein